MDDDKYYRKYLKYKARYQNEMLKKEMSGGYYDMLFNGNVGNLGGIKYNLTASVNYDNLYGQSNYFTDMMNNIQNSYINNNNNQVPTTSQQNKNKNNELSIPQKVRFILNLGSNNSKEYLVNRNDPNFQSKNFIKQLYYSNINNINNSIGGGPNDNIIISKSIDVKDEIDDNYLKEVMKVNKTVKLYLIKGGGNTITIQTDLSGPKNFYGLSNQLIPGFSENMTLGESLKEMGRLHQLVDTPFIVDPTSKNVLSVKENNDRLLGDFKNNDNIVEMYFKKYKTLPVSNLQTNIQHINNKQLTTNKQSIYNISSNNKEKFEDPYPFTETEQSINSKLVSLKQKPLSNTSFEGPYSFTETEQSINNKLAPLKQKLSSNTSFDGPYSFTETEQSINSELAHLKWKPTSNISFDGPYSFTDLTEKLVSETPSKHSTLDTLLTNKSLFEGPFSFTEQSVSNNVSTLNGKSTLTDQSSFTNRSSFTDQSSFMDQSSFTDQSLFTDGSSINHSSISDQSSLKN